LVEELKCEQVLDDDGKLLGERKVADGASLVAVELAGADLRWASMQRVDLRRADLRGANFDGADVSWADFDGAKLAGASFRGARMLDTTFQGADLEGADFTHVSGLSAAAIRGAKSIDRVRWPTGFSTVEPRTIGKLLHT
jgi:hypothetical protein